MNIVYLCFLALGFTAIQCMAGGTRLILSLPCYAVLALVAIMTAVSSRRAETAPNLSCMLGTTLMGGYVLCRSSHSPIDYLGRADFFMMLGCLVTYFLTALYITKTRDRLIFVCLLLALVVPEVIIGSIQFTQKNGYMPFGFLRGDDSQRASGMFVSPNHFAGYLEAVGILALSFTVWSRWPLWAKIVAGYLAGFCWFGIAISGSRGGYFSAMASLIAFAVASIYAVKLIDPRKLVLVWIFLAVGMLIIVGGAAFLMFQSDLLTKRIHMMTAKDIRIYNWMAALDQYRLDPVFGTGAGTHLIYGRQFRRPPLQADPIHAHCDYLELLAEYGIIGACVTAVFLFAHVRNGLRAYSFLLRKRLIVSSQPRSDSFALNVGVLCSLAALGVHSIVDFNMHAPGDALLYAFLFGTLANPGLEDETGWVAQFTPWFRLALPAIGIWLAVKSTPMLPTEYCAEVARVALRNHDFIRSMDYARKGLGEVPLEPQGVDNLIKRFGGDSKNPYYYFYIGESNRGMALGVPNKRLRAVFYRNAVDAYRKSLVIFPQNESALVRLGQSLDGAGLYDEAEEAFEQAIQADPNLGAIYGYYGAHLEVMGKKDEATQAFTKGRELGHEGIDQLGRKELGL